MILRGRFLSGILFCCLPVSPLFALTADEAYQAGSALYQQGKWDLSISQCREAVRLNPDQWQAYQVMGQAYFQQGDSNAALDACRISLSINANNPTLDNFVRTKLNLKGAEPPSQTAYQQGLDLYKQGKIEEGITNLREAVHQDPNNWQAYEELGYAYFDQGNFGASLDACRVSLWIHPENFSLRTFMDSKAKPQLLAALSGQPVAASAASTPEARSKNAFYLDLGSSQQLNTYNGYSPAFQFGLGYGIGVSRNYSLILETHYAGFTPLNSYYYPVPVYYSGTNSSISGGGLHILSLIPNSKFNFTDRDNPVVFYGCVGFGLSWVFEDALTVNYTSPTGSYTYPGSSNLDWTLSFGIGLEIKLTPGVALTIDNSLVFPIVVPNYNSNSYFYGAPDYGQFSLGLKLDQ